MNTSYPKPQKLLRPMALLLSVLLGVPFFAGCAGQRNSAPPPPVDNTRADGGTQNYPASAPQAKKKGLSTGQKAVITLAGAAALYYLYKQHQNKQQEGAQGKYYLSKNGRVYYRDAQHRPHWVTPPSGGIQVPANEAQQYRGFQGYDNSPTGRDLAGLGSAPVPAQ
jgi:hypothetical protein